MRDISRGLCGVVHFVKMKGAIHESEYRSSRGREIVRRFGEEIRQHHTVRTIAEGAPARRQAQIGGKRGSAGKPYERWKIEQMGGKEEKSPPEDAEGIEAFKQII
jgi:hypothetical protein